MALRMGIGLSDVDALRAARSVWMWGGVAGMEYE
jgi:hypothetical protein